MGVTGLWTVVHPCARPVKIETLNKKRLAVDASIWIYQFLKAVRDKEGNALRNSHVVGFFRRICKLLFFGIKPVFVFDGGAPTLKRQTINNRKRRREGRRDDAVRTAGKLLALQMQRLAEEEEQKRKDEVGRSRHTVVEEEPLPENLVYVDEMNMTPQERQQNRKFKKKDAYHLPELDASLAEMGQPNDPRIMSLEELQMYAQQFNSGEDINVYDFSKIDFDSPFFTSLPPSDRYNILNAARLRSRLRMGYSKEQLDTMFPDRMAFSRFQIERVAERNNLTQRLMHLNSIDSDLAYGVNGVSRVAGEKGREYVLVKNDGVEGGWALGVVTNKDEGQRNKPINIETLDQHEEEEEDSDEDEEFEDVPIEGLNRLPKRPKVPVGATDDLIARDQERRRALYQSRKTNTVRKPKTPATDDPESLFVAAESDGEEWEDVGIDLMAQSGANDADVVSDEEEELQRAIAMSLQQDVQQETNASDIEEEDDYQEVFEQSRVEEARPFTKGSGKSIAHIANMRSTKVAAKPFVAEDSDDDEIDLQAALAESRRTMHKPKLLQVHASVGPSGQAAPKLPAATAKAAGFDGPLPFEKLNLGTSLLGKKKMQKLTEDAAGGFEREPETSKKKPTVPLPPWFSGNLETDLSAQKAREDEERRQAQEAADDDAFIFDEPLRLRKQDPREVIDLDAPEQKTQQSIIEIESSNEENDSDTEMQDATSLEPPVRMDDVAEHVRTQPTPPREVGVASNNNKKQSFGQRDTLDEAMESDDESLEWEDSDHEETVGEANAKPAVTGPVGGSLQLAEEDKLVDGSDDEEEEFEDALVVSQPPRNEIEAPDSQIASLSVVEEIGAPAPDLASNFPADELEDDAAEEDLYSDPEDEELFRQLAQEEEEHARFASTLNNRSMSQNIADYEKELKQLRNQQAKDRRDADEVTQAMVAECQQLLSLFGLPYITAPMEAEAQCAELVTLGLVDGIVTDDSDIFLFGGTRVYKNMFNQAKFVECYLTSDLESEFGLSRQRLISIAQLLGSDYTEGLPGVGPVTALEILSEFENLPAFKEWLTAVQIGQRSKQDDASSLFKKKFRKSATKVFLPPSFPDLRVEEAYLKPEVDSDPSAFVWGVPDLSALRSFLMSTIGWSPERTDEVLVPVIKDMNRRLNEGTQANITAFFGGGVGAGSFAPRRKAEAGSKRLESALHKIGQKARGDTNAGGDDAQADDDVVVTGAAATQKQGSKRVSKVAAKRSKQIVSVEDSDGDEDDELYEAAPKKKARRITKKPKSKKAATPEAGDST